MGVSYSQPAAGVLAAALERLQEAELAPVAEGVPIYDALLCADSWDTLLAEFPGDDVRAVRDSHPRNIAFAIAYATNALETETAADHATPERNVALASGAAHLLTRLLPYIVGNVGLGCGTGNETTGLTELHRFLSGGPLPRTREYVEPFESVVLAKSSTAGAQAGESADSGPEPSEVTAPPEAVPDTRVLHDSEAQPGSSLWRRVCSVIVDALLCPGLTLSPRSKAWAPPLSPGTASLPPDADFTPNRVEALRLLVAVCGAEALSIPSTPAPLGDSSPPGAHNRESHRFLAVLSGRLQPDDDASNGVCAVSAAQLSRLLLSLVNGASCSPGITDGNPQGAELVFSCMRAVILLVIVAEHDLPVPSAPDDAAALFAALGAPQAACLHASIASVLATAASQAAGAAEWADVLAETVAGDAQMARLVGRVVPPGAGEALALGLAAAERMPSFMPAATGFSSHGGWMLAGPVLALMASLREAPSAAGLLRAGSFLLLLLSTSKQFCLALNEPLRVTDAPVCTATGLGSTIPPSATRGDALLAALAILLAYPLSGGACITPQGRALYSPLLAVFRNVSPFLKGLTPAGAGGAMHLLASLAQPSVLLADEAGAQLLTTALNSIAAVVDHQCESNAALLAALLRHRSLLSDLATMTLAPPVCEISGADAETPPPAIDAGDVIPTTEGSALLVGLTIAPPAERRAFHPDDEWLDGVRSGWPLQRLLGMLDFVSPTHTAWRAAHPAADVYAEAAWLATQTLAGSRAHPPEIPRPSTYARTSAVAAWQVRYALSLVLLADPHAYDGPRVRRLKVARLTRVTSPAAAA